jgi:hypothetical protein
VRGEFFSYEPGRYVRDGGLPDNTMYRVRGSPSAYELEHLIAQWVRALFLSNPWCSVVSVR